MKKQFGFSLIGVLLIIGALILTAGGMVVWERKILLKSTPTTVPTSSTLSFTPTPIQSSPSPPPSSDQVIVTTVENIYQHGEEIQFTITNNSERTIYFYDCSRTPVFKAEGDDLIGLTTYTDEDWPSIFEIAPQKTRQCYWDQKAYFDPDRQDSSRYQHYVTSGLVPPGSYLFQLQYAFEKSGIYLSGNLVTARSQLITIK